MKIALASAKVCNNDIAFNLAQLRLWMARAKEQGAELVCFGEAFLQGFDAFSWEYEKDRDIACSVQDKVFEQVKAETEHSGIDVLFGFLERDGETLYSSCALLAEGELIQLYRRVSVGWKEYTKADGHYCEGNRVETFQYRGRKCVIALCGDLWDVTAPQFQQGQEITFWPLYINYSREDWYGEAGECRQYAEKAAEFGGHVLMINSVDEPAPQEDPALGGCCHFADGGIKAQWPLGSEGILLIDI